MKRELITRRSDALGKDMSLIMYGEKGHPIIAFQPQGSKCNAFEDFGMVEALSEAIESGTIQLFSVDNNDEESWSNTDGDKAQRSAKQEAFFTYMTDELVPLVHELSKTDERPLVIGCSMGATHAALAALRRPDLFQGCIALSGIYDARYYFGDWMDSTLYDNSIVSFLPNMPTDHSYIDLYGKRQLVFCVGQGAWEDQGIADLRVIADTCHEKGIDAWCDFWGYDVSHDWPWWKKQIRYFLPIVLNDMEKTLAEEESKAKRTTKKATTTAANKTKKKVATTKATTKKVSDDAKTSSETPQSDTKTAATKPVARARRAPKKATNDAKATTAASAVSDDVAKAEAPSVAKKAAEESKPATKQIRTRTKTASSKAQTATKQAATTADQTKSEPAKKAPATTSKTRSTTKSSSSKASTTKTTTKK